MGYPEFVIDRLIPETYDLNKRNQFLIFIHFPKGEFSFSESLSGAKCGHFIELLIKPWYGYKSSRGDAEAR